MSDSARHVSRPASFTGRFGWAGYLLGFGLGGFFDGILLHQVLQWHHLLSSLEGSAFRDIRVQILADGLFHVLMYLIAGAGLWLLWRTRREYGEPGADRLLFANALIGFGAWHILDSILSHWILGIHRIRVEVDNPLFWDLLWFFLFGVAFVAAGWLLRRGGSARSGGGRSGGRRERAPGRHGTAPALLALAALVAGPVAALPPPDVTSVVVLFRPGTTAVSALNAMAAVDGRLLWSDPSGQLWAFDLASGGEASALYRHGALLVSNSLLPVGCFNWTRV
ncbi:MAG: DUF2243 domain-containing protein [Tistlia sp.]|uniref:DUF2243 domain-containing protein n=1 Tax=Tistlia sp. TaxID=3057121 RepID=UPI0034A46447